MSELERLITELCPDGVEYRPLEDVCKVNSPPKKILSNDIANAGSYPVIDQGAEFISGFTEDESALLPQNQYIIFGDHTEIIKYIDFAFAQGADGIKILTSKGCICRYLYHAFSCKYIKSGKYTRHWSVAKTTLIPLPPIEVQREIVRILDNFTELTAELTARKQQYEHYRDSLLAFGDDVEWKSLGDITLKTNNIKWNDNSKLEYYYIDLCSVSRENNKVYDTQLINATNAPSRAQQIVITNDVIFGATRPMLKRFCLIPNEYNEQICSTGFCVLRANTEIVLPKWIFYHVSTLNFYDYIEKNQKGASYPAITDRDVKAYNIPIPHLDEQERIVAILDRFDALCNDISSGLPAEIEARKKQYEYYRDKLLTFKELGG